MARKDKIPPSQRPERQLTLNLHFFQPKDGSAVDHQDVIKQVQGFVADNIGDIDSDTGIAIPPMFVPIWQDKFASAMLDSA